MRYLIILVFGVMCLSSRAVAAPPAEAFGALPAVHDAAISPDAKQIAIFINVEGTYGVRILNLREKETVHRLIMLSKDVKPQWIKWANNSQILISLWQSDKIGTTPVDIGAIYTLDSETMKGKFLIKAPAGVVRQFNNDVIDFLEDDPNHILMSFSDDDVFAPEIQKVDVKTGRYSRQKRGSKLVQEWFTDLRGEPRIGQGRSERRAGSWNLTIRDADSDKWRKSDDYPGLAANADIFGFTKNPNELIIGAYNGKDTLGLYIYDLGQKRRTRKLFHNEKYDASGLILNGDGTDVIGANFVADTTETELFGTYDTTLDKMRRKYSGYTVDYVDQSRNSQYVMFKVSNAYDPGALMLYDGSVGAEQRLISIHPKLDTDEMGTVVGVRYTARDGAKIPAYVTLPPKITDNSQLKNIPFIVLPHGGPYARDDKRFDYFAQFFASRGFGVLQMNFRGSDGYGKAFKDAGRKNWVVMQEDVEDGTRFLIDKGYADPNRICIAGWSYGGYASLMGAIKNSELYKCAISMAGVTDLFDMVYDLKKYRFGKFAARDFVLKGFENKDAIKENSPVKRADEIKVPLFLAHGTYDQRVHFDQFKRMKSALKKSPAKVTYMTFKNEDHFLSNQENRQKFFKGLDKFLEESVGKSEFAQ